MFVVRLFLLSVLLFLLPAASAMSQESWGARNRYCAIVDWAWTSVIKTDNDNADRKTTRFTGPYLFYWAKIEGDRGALEYMRQTKKIPITLNWYNHSGYVYFDQTKTVSLKDDEIAALTAQCEQDGTWTYRIWDYRYRSGTWKMIPLYPNGNEAECRAPGGPCASIIHYTNG